MDSTIRQDVDSMADEECRLVADRNAAFEAARVKPTQVNRRTYRLACAALKDFLRVKAEFEPPFTSMGEVLAHLQADGWKISQTTLYIHRAQGKIRATIQGQYKFTAVNEYARHHLVKLNGTRE